MQRIPTGVTNPSACSCRLVHDWYPITPARHAWTYLLSPGEDCLVADTLRVRFHLSSPHSGIYLRKLIAAQRRLPFCFSMLNPKARKPTGAAYHTLNNTPLQSLGLSLRTYVKDHYKLANPQPNKARQDVRHFLHCLFYINRSDLQKPTDF